MNANVEYKMKLCHGLPPEPDYTLGITKKLAYSIDEIIIPSLIIAIFIMTPMFYFLWRIYWRFEDIFWMFEHDQFFQFLGIIILSMIFHEFVHLLFFPKFGLSAESYLGFDPKSRMPYVAHNGVLSKRRFICVAIAPLVIISIGCLILAFYLPQWRSQLAMASIYNAAGAGGDIYIIGLVLIRVPNGCYIQRQYFGATPD